MEFSNSNTGIVVTDPQNDFLHEEGAAYGLVSESLKENQTIDNLGRLLEAGKSHGYGTYVSPHYFYPTDRKWKFGGRVEEMMHEIKMFERKGPLSLEGLEGSGADFYAPLKHLIEDGKTIVTNPHKVYGPQQNDLALQLHKHGVSKVILAGMSANLCVESHMRHLIEEGFEVYVVKDATAAAKHPDMGDGYAAALTNFKYIASGVLSTDEVISALDGTARRGAAVSAASAASGPG